MVCQYASLFCNMNHHHCLVLHPAISINLHELFQTCIAIFFFFGQVHYMNFIEKKTFALSPFYNKYQQFHFCMNLYSSVSCCECKRCGCICRQVCICLNIANVFAIWQCKCICRELGQMQLQHWLCPHVWMEMDIVHWKSTKSKVKSARGMIFGRGQEDQINIWNLYKSSITSLAYLLNDTYIYRNPQ